MSTQLDRREGTMGALELEGVMTDIPETIIFDVNDEGLIRRMSLYLKQPGGLAPDGGQDATGATGG
jgi:hypothetical protein